MKQIPRIPEAEWKVMEAVWNKSPITAAEVIAAVGRQERWHDKTVKTLLHRLVKKKALTFEKQGRAYIYEPKLSRADCVKMQSESFLDRVFGGSLKPMLAYFIDSKKLSASDVKDLKDLLNKRK